MSTLPATWEPLQLSSVNQTELQAALLYFHQTDFTPTVQRKLVKCLALPSAGQV